MHKNQAKKILEIQDKIEKISKELMTLAFVLGTEEELENELVHMSKLLSKYLVAFSHVFDEAKKRIKK